MSSEIARAPRALAVGAALAAAFVVPFAGCGKFGTKDPRDSAIDYGAGSSGCLNELGPQFQKFSKGEISREEWQGVFVCANGALAEFRKFVRGSANGAYTRADMRTFVGRFLVTNQPITEELVAVAFELKASLFGGSDQTVSGAELDRFVALMDVVGAETANLIPHLYNRLRYPNQAALFALATAVESFAARLALAFGSPGTRHFPRASVATLAAEVAKIAKLEVPENFANWAMAGKALFLGGSELQIETSWWPRAIRMAGVYGGLALASSSAKLDSMTGPNELGEFLMALGRRLHTALRQTMGFHGTSIPFARLESLIDKLPASWLPVPAVVIKASLGPGITQLLGGKTPRAFDRAALDTLLERAEFWTRGQTHLEKIFARFVRAPDGVPVDVFKREAESYSAGFGQADKSDVQRLISLASTFKPMFREDDHEVTFDSRWQGRSLRQLTHLHWMRIAVDVLLKGYSTHPDGDKGLVSDFLTVFQHWTPLLRHYQKADPRQADQLHIQRFRDANLFMPCSDGNDWVDANEGTYYLAYLLSAGIGGGQFITDMQAKCKSLGKDEWGAETYEPECYRRALFSEPARYWSRFPEYLAFYAAQTLPNRLMVDRSIEQAARFGGYQDTPVSGFDLDSGIGVTHYIEGMFQRFDVNRSGMLSLAEVETAFPVFRKTIAEIGKQDPNSDLLKSVFTYIVKYGRIPDQSDPTDVAQLLLWHLTPVKSVSADRLALFKVIAMLATPPAP